MMDKELLLLNSAQQQAVTHLGTPLLILAGPGSGKTLVITRKIAWLIEHAKVPAHKILAMTFTNKAAREMKERVRTVVSAQDWTWENQPFVSTFHSFGAYLLRWFHQEAELPRNFQIYDQHDQATLLAEAVPRLGERKAESTTRKIAFLKERGITAHSGSELMEEIGLDPSHYQQYEKVKRETGNVDFGDLLLMPYLLLKKNGEALQKIQATWQWYLVDEYQDTNTLQYLFLSMLCRHTANLCVVGDDDQSIYKFRGAEVENILNFGNKFAQVAFIRLEENYRSTPQILELANNIIANNTGRHQKKIFTSKAEGRKPELVHFNNEMLEQNFIAKMAQEARDSNVTLGIFFRINAFSRNCETALIKAGIPYEVVGATSFYAREEVKTSLALLRLYKNKKDLVSFQRVINRPARGIGQSSMQKILEQMKEGHDWETAVEAVAPLLSAKAHEGIKKFAAIFSEGAAQEQQNVGSCLKAMLKKSDLWDYYEEEDKDKNTERINNVEEIISYASDFDTTEEGWINFFEQISLVEQGPGEKSSEIQLMSLHRSKGLEFDRVLICGVEDGLFPLERKSEEADMEEERRLFYVGVTRARAHMVLSYCSQRRRFGYLKSSCPSLFLMQIDEELVDKYTFSPGNFDESETESYDGWGRGDQVEHSEYGIGHVRRVMHTGKHLVIDVEFTNDYEAMFIPKYTPSLRKIEKADSYDRKEF